MANRKKDNNPLVTERLNILLQENKTSSRWLCNHVLVKDGYEYNTSNFSRFTTGKAQPPDWIIERLANHFGVRYEWLRGLDNYRTQEERFRHDAVSFLSKMGAIASDPETPEKIDKLERICFLSELYDQFEKMYHVPTEWKENQFSGEAFKLLSYIDNELQHSFESYFKYVYEKPEKEK